jgi:hypothetical protein
MTLSDEIAGKGFPQEALGVGDQESFILHPLEYYEFT